MGRQNYMTISVADTVQEMFNEFVAKEGLTKTAALNDVLEMYMISKNEDLYMELKKKYLNVEAVRNMIADRDSTEDSESEFIFMKLGRYYTFSEGETTVMDGEETIRIYIKDASERGYTWFSTQSLYYGMSDKRVKYYNKKIESGEKVRILFAINNENFDNDIAFSGDIVTIHSSNVPESCPEENAYPAEFVDEKARIWIKLKNIVEETSINASMLEITSTHRDLKQTICNAQYHFGYVSYKIGMK